ncbi:hypothetical protein [Bradyrhizobium yuanmingense]|uniref:hypothetical protein n=1 Tax=Bradyrhizobium yuanmingense TaxID=108015 RepID=UPI0023B8EDC6|nr:hypothetical protein [Bradyrhizobium yuanmingense]MDF0578084.1 hypothetical protein [Bradyrhizobium yuanmingense]
MFASNRSKRVPRSAVRQNLLYTIESLARRTSQIQAAQQDGNSASEFFEATHRDLDTFKMMVERDLKLRQVYIYQKLFDISRDLFRYAPPSDVEYQFLFLQQALVEDREAMSDEDKKSFDELRKEVVRLQKEGTDKRLSAQALGAIWYFSKIIQDRQILTIWNSEKLVITSLRLGALLCLGALASTCAAAALTLYDPPNQPGATKYGVDVLRLLGAIFGGITGGCISAIATSRNASDETVIPLINTDWMRPILGGVAGLVFGLIVTAGVGEVRSAFVIGGAMAFGFSEQLLYSWLRRRAEQLEKQLGTQVVHGASKARRGR